ncbi:CoA transferase [Bradyrhizobium sp. U87765 SZCCT0131]|uniref:CaiB/BaiF CoA transferase family protein n=1 Tax=unclassified Bradyrhizobium TaxID=2631580 RepID=UPI001BAD9166|nr:MULTISPECIES: CoA transferase [unclassified Bradyrhizobium]MBR1221683.1 CoA transferase [Bradyrhizobium sp. U87765 SZCCT0131]MBR1264394.1 CoA transferase [Bradyrhizobium sp. U87765 SZCCT0134]MBR1304699.1 CoA transferase [Bradyrhizobium sp. U87765 SZCCT0110]MBR1322444.1 CoA transferase [Bradyrhizobium sp. U87765 SZCCT0109]MBR1346628.1 CoA transferase [Bradyrhizobium sp. U87765 SZCCT0048]
MGPLDGLTILDLTTVLMGPYATQILADMGANVIKVESPEGDIVRQIGPGRTPGMGGMFLNANRGKRSIAIDLKNKDGRDALLRLVETADALVYNVRPQAMARLGLDYETLSAINPRLVYVGVFGYGQSGPYAAKPAYDDLIQGASTIPTLLAAAGDGTPRYVPITMADRVVGLMAVNAILGGLMHQQRAGVGQRIDVPMFECMTDFVLIDHLGGLTYDPPLDHGGYARLLSRYRKPYRTSDGHLCVLIYNDKQWRSFFEAIGRLDFLEQPRFANHAARHKHIDEIYEEIGQIFLTRTTAEWRALLETADIPVMPMHTLESILDDPHLNAVGFFKTVDHPTEGRVRQMQVPSTWSVSQPQPGGPAPTLGEHGREILRNAGFTPEEIERLASQNAVFLGAQSARSGSEGNQ